MEEKEKKQGQLTTALVNEFAPPSFLQLANQLEELVRMALDAEKHGLKPNISYTEVMQDLMMVKRAVDVLSRDQQEVEKFLAFAKDRYGPLPEKEIMLRPEDVKAMDKLKGLQTLCEAAQERLHEQLLQHPEKQKELQEKLEYATASKKKKIVRRKNKFRSMGGDEKWMKT